MSASSPMPVKWDYVSVAAAARHVHPCRDRGGHQIAQAPCCRCWCVCTQIGFPRYHHDHHWLPSGLPVAVATIDRHFLSSPRRCVDWSGQNCPIHRQNKKHNGILPPSISWVPCGLWQGPHLSKMWLSSGNPTISVARHNIAPIVVVNWQNSSILHSCVTLCANVIVFCHSLTKTPHIAMQQTVNIFFSMKLVAIEQTHILYHFFSESFVYSIQYRNIIKTTLVLLIRTRLH
jgi:hypothetical protein